nr:unnamed protein product [Digitaria exilis]
MAAAISLPFHSIPFPFPSGPISRLLLWEARRQWRARRRRRRCCTPNACTRSSLAAAIVRNVVHDGDDDISHLTGTIAGPADSPYEGGTFLIDIRLPSEPPPTPPGVASVLILVFWLAGEYPFEPPKTHFITKVWHPNISSQNGAICLDILKDQWSTALTLRTALLSLQALLSSPVPDDPQDAVVAQQYLHDYPAFVATARYWTETFAKSTSTGMEEKVQKLVEMGFPEDLVRSTLKSVDGDENMALEKLCSG